MTFKYNREIYPRTALIKAAYHFTDVAYLHLDCDRNYYLVIIEPKKGHQVKEQDFENEILAQLARYEIFRQTREIREISLARAMASSVVQEKTSDNSSEGDEDIPADTILKDWFDTHEQHSETS